MNRIICLVFVRPLKHEPYSHISLLYIAASNRTIGRLSNRALQRYFGTGWQIVQSKVLFYLKLNVSYEVNENDIKVKNEFIQIC